jgi:sugar phosphate isomerase/epimerase
MKLQSAAGHLTYCTNIHRGETWPEVWSVLLRDLPLVKQRVAPRQPFGVGLRLSNIAVEALHEPAVLAEFSDFLRTNDLYVFTLNAFPYGPFHGVRVKEAVYLPDWQDEERLRYTNAAADVLAQLLPDDPTIAGSISTVPGAFKPNVTSAAVVERMAALMLRHVAHLVAIKRQTGRQIALAIEPEPYCFIETIDESIAFFEAHLFARTAIAKLAALTGTTQAEAEADLHRHIGLCLDLCHAAVEYEDPNAAFGKLAHAGISIPKMQVSSGLRLPHVDASTEALLQPFVDGVYLHQVVERTDAGLVRYPDLAEAFKALRVNGVAAREWRVHYHVPIFLDDLGAFASTQSFVREALALHRRAPLSDHLEVETYTWDVLPARYRTGSLVGDIARELEWAAQQLSA